MELLYTIVLLPSMRLRPSQAIARGNVFGAVSLSMSSSPQLTSRRRPDRRGEENGGPLIEIKVASKLGLKLTPAFLP
jgi:hypothetical protein